MRQLALALLLLLLPAVGYAAGPAVVASTSWAAAFARAAGAGDVTVIAPDNLQHPPDYDPKPSDLVAVAKADVVVYGGFERFAERLSAAVGDPAKALRLELENSPSVIRHEVLRLAERLGTKPAAEAFLARFETQARGLHSTLIAAGAGKTTAAVQRWMLPWAELAGLKVVGVFGPKPVTPSELAQLAQAAPQLILDNAHAPQGEPLAQATGARRVVLRNFPTPGTGLPELFQANSDALLTALKELRP